MSLLRSSFASQRCVYTGNRDWNVFYAKYLMIAKNYCLADASVDCGDDEESVNIRHNERLEKKKKFRWCPIARMWNTWGICWINKRSDDDENLNNVVRLTYVRHSVDEKFLSLASLCRVHTYLIKHSLSSCWHHDEFFRRSKTLNNARVLEQQKDCLVLGLGTVNSLHWVIILTKALTE